MHKVIANKSGGEHVPLTEEEVAAREAESAIAEVEKADRLAEVKAKKVKKDMAIGKLQALGLDQSEIDALFS